MRIALLLLACVLIPITAGTRSSSDQTTSPRHQQIRTLIDEGRYATADSLSRVLLAEFGNTYGVESMETAGVLDLLVEANWRWQKGRDPEVLQYAETAVAIREELQGHEHADLAVALFNLASMHYAGGEYEAAKEHLERALEIGEEALGPEHPDLARIELLYARVLSCLGQSSEAKPHYERALAIQESVLGENHLEVGRTLRWYSWYWQGVGDVQSALVSFARYDRHVPDTARIRTPGPRPIVEPYYIALIQRRDEPEPVAIDLGSADEIDDLVSAWRREFETDLEFSDLAYRRTAAGLRHRIWDPVAEYLEEIEKVFVVPDGALNLVSIVTLPGDDGGYLVEKGPVIHYVSAERDLMPSESLSPTGAGLLALGGPDYGAGIGREKTESEMQLVSATSFRGRRSGCAEFAQISFTPLPGATEEASEIASLWERASNDHEVLHLTGAQAMEEILKAAAPGKRVLHLATHGFFLGQCASALDARSFNQGLMAAREQQPSIEGENPLILSGLALAGANQRASAGPDVEDGILTAQEIGALDLSGVEVAVLSAYDTGVGEIANGEGVFGLRRAFQVAGARTLVMSLWPVDDESTRQWMLAFYEGWLVDGLSKAEAVRRASLSVLESRRSRGDDIHPFYWGAFVAAGDYR
jgi:CHAT domain-containing protein